MIMVVCMDRIHPNFTCFKKFGSGLQMSQVYQSHKNMMFLTKCMNILTFLVWEKKSIGAGEATNRKELEKEKMMCKSVITESGLRLQRMKDGYVQ